MQLCHKRAVASPVQLRAVSRCDKFCTEQYAPVCGSDGKTYSNMCFLSVAACQYQEKGMTLTAASHGECGANHFLHVDQSACNLICDEERKPVCASDGNVYDNTCLFKRAECEAANNNTRLSILLYGDSCPTPTVPDCSKYQVDTSDIAVEGGISLKPSCPHTLDYVCASDGQSYASECQLCHSMDVNQVDLTISYSGVCHQSATHLGSGAVSPLDALLNQLLHHGGEDPLVG
ncbi:ovomucoid-like [Babylonia areolata]|uniref:ovomucoid-like n=1 Tax=Babylonia areolata TaxID=304850 RepID=UPI003FD1D407